jgi:hypothetical protein
MKRVGISCSKERFQPIRHSGTTTSPVRGLLVREDIHRHTQIIAPERWRCPRFWRDVVADLADWVTAGLTLTTMYGAGIPTVRAVASERVPENCRSHRPRFSA